MSGLKGSKLRWSAGSSLLLAQLLGVAGAHAQEVTPIPPAAQPAPVTAPAAPASQDDVIIVFSRARALQTAIDEKRRAPNTLDVLSADQAGRFPDNTAAEALRRLPGVSFQRETDSGEGQFISIRGLDSALNNVQLNGINAATASGDSQGTRRLELDILGTENVEAIRVSKSLLPENEGEGIGGAVDIVTRSPLSVGKDRLNLRAEGRFSEFADQVGARVSAFGTKQLSKNLAFSLTAAYSLRHITSIEVDVDSTPLAPLVIPPFTGADGEPVLFTSLGPFDLSDGLLPLDSSFSSEQVDLTEDIQIRENFTIGGAVEWKPWGHTSLELKGQFDLQTADTTEQTLEFDTAVSFPASAETPEGLRQAVFSNPQIVFEGEIEDDRETNSLIALEGETNLDRWKLRYIGSFSRATDSQPVLSIDFLQQLTAPNTFAPFDSSGNAQFPQPNLNATALAALNNPLSAPDDDFDLDLVDSQTNNRFAGVFDAEYNVGGKLLQTIKGGLKFERSVIEQLVIDLADNENDILVDGSFAPDNPAAGSFTLAQSGLLEQLLPLDSINNPFLDAGITFIPGFDREGLLQFRENFLASFDGDPEQVETLQAFENRFAGYLQTSWEFGRLGVTAGLRVEHYRANFASSQATTVDVEFQGDSLEIEDPSTVQPLLVSSTVNTEILPRIVARYDVGDRVVLRGAFTTSLARPQFSALAAQNEINVDLEFANVLEGVDLSTLTLADLTELEINATVGNPELENAYSLNFDAGVEWYPNRNSAVTVGFFYKRITNFLFNDELGDFEQEGVAGVALSEILDGLALTTEGAALLAALGGGAALAASPDIDIELEQPQNGNVARVIGVEFGLTHQFSWAPGFLDGFGFFGNVTYQDTETVIDVGVLGEGDALVELGLAEAGDIFQRTVPFFNSPPVTANAQLYYEKHGISAAVSYSYQGDSIAELEAAGFDEFVQDFDQLDLSFEYTFPSSKFGRFAWFFLVNDITDGGQQASQFQSLGRAGLLSDLASFNGREFRAGIRANW